MKATLTALLLATALTTSADDPWKATLECKEEQLNLVIDLNEQKIKVPNFDMFGPQAGYVNGKGVYDTWIITSHKILNDSVASVRMSNEWGADTQAAQIICENDSTYKLNLTGSVYFRRLVNRKFKDLPKSMTFTVKK